MIIIGASKDDIQQLATGLTEERLAGGLAGGSPRIGVPRLRRGPFGWLSRQADTWWPHTSAIGRERRARWCVTGRSASRLYT